MKEHLENALKYIRENKTWCKEEEDAALALMYWHFSLPPTICNAIYDLMEEYGYENGLPGGWWTEQFTEDDIFLKL